MNSLCAAIAVTLVLGSVPAWAMIRITDSRYENDTLTVAGQAGPDQEVTLDGKYKTKADTGGHFQFSVKKYKPPTCMADIAAGDDTYSAIVTNCLLDDAAASANSALNDTTPKPQ